MDRLPLDEPSGVGNFLVEIDGDEVGCSAVLGLGLESRDQLVTPVTLRRSAGSDPTFWSWAREPSTRTVTVTLLDLRREPVCRYVLRDARPEKWTGPALDALSGDVALEELVISAEKLDIEPVR
jgi:T4-like virus tail tube protein gp19